MDRCNGIEYRMGRKSYDFKTKLKREEERVDKFPPCYGVKYFIWVCSTHNVHKSVCYEMDSKITHIY